MFKHGLFWLMLISLIYPSAYSQTAYIWNGGTGAWNNAANWTPNGVPGAADAAKINSGQANINIPTTVAALVLDNGSIGGSDTLTISSNLNWLRGRMYAAGVTVLAASASAQAGESGITIGLSDTRTFVNRGNFNFNQGNFNNSGGILFVNEGTVNWNNNRPLNTGTFQNQSGASLNIAGSETTTFSATVENNGTITVENGILNLNGGGTDNGVYNLNAGARVQFGNGVRTLTSSSTINAPNAIVEFSSNVTTIEGSYTAAVTDVFGGTAEYNVNVTLPVVHLDNGELSGSGNHLISDSLQWTRGQMSGSGVTMLDSMASVTIDGVVATTIGLLDTRQLVNNTTVEWNAMNFSNNSGTNLINNGLININSDRTYNGGQFNNSSAGTINYLAGGQSTVSAIFNNDGAVNIQGGILHIKQSGTDSGTYHLDPGSRLEFGNGVRTLAASSVIDAPNATVEFFGNVTKIEGSYNTGVTDVFGGIAEFNVDVTLPTVHLDNGALSGTGNHLITDTLQWIRGQIRGSGVTTLDSLASVTIEGAVTTTIGLLDTRQLLNNAAFEWNNMNFSNHSGTELVNNGIININSNRTFSGGQLTNNPGGVIDALGSGLTKIQALFTNNGLLMVPDGTFDVDYGGISSGIFRSINNGAIEFSNLGHDLTPASRLEGDGSFAFTAFSGNINNSAVTAPGLSTGELRVTTDFPLDSLGSLEIEIGGYTPVSEYDRLVVFGSANLNGDLDVSFINGFTPQLGDTFRVIGSNGVSGQFQAISAQGFVVQPTYDSTGVVLTVSSLINQAPIAVDDSLLTRPNTPDTVNVLRNDSDPDGDPLTRQLVIAPVHGTVSAVGDSSFRYLAPFQFSGPDSFRYRVSDPNGANDEAWVHVYVDAAFEPFTRMFTPIDGISSSAASWGDYDNDGDLDFIVSGRDTNNVALTRLWRNDGNGSFFERSGLLPDRAFSIAAWADYDKDGDLDIFLSGSDMQPTPTTYAAIYENINSYFYDIGAPILPVVSGSADWIDIDLDGILDLLVTGAEQVLNTPRTRLYMNNDGVFEVNPYYIGRLADVHSSVVIWADYNNDGLTDLFLTGTGYDSTLGQPVAVTKIYKNSVLLVDLQASLPPLIRSRLDLGDYDNDGDLDLLLTGLNIDVTSWTTDAYIFRNDGNDQFTDIQAALTGVQDGTARWIDYDGDGDLDIYLSGRRMPGGIYITQLYQNNNGVFNLDSAGLPGVSSASAWGDYDNDGDLDILLTGYDGSQRVAWLYRNNSTTPNSPPLPPTALSSDANYRRVNLSWDQGNDAETPSTGLSYNLRVGSTPGGSDIFDGMARDDGARKVVALGNAFQDTARRINRPPQDQVYYWQVQAIDHNYQGSAWSAIDSFYVPYQPFTSLDTGLIPLDKAALDWGDFDSDGDLDLVMAGRDSSRVPQTILYQNNGGVLSQMSIVLPAIHDGVVEWADFDNDNDLDLLLMGRSTSPPSRIMRLLRNDGSGGNGWQFTDVNAPFEGMADGDVAWGDYDNDGDLDLLYMGRTAANQPMTGIWKNSGLFFVQEDSAFTPVGNGSCAWVDYDSDSDLDAVVSGSTASGTPLTTIYRNDGGSFSAEMTGIESLHDGGLAWGDYNNDGRPDLLIGGQDSNGTGWTRIYRNDGPSGNQWLFTLNSSPIINLRRSTLSWGDYDNDGDLDALIAGVSVASGDSSSFTIIYRNDGNNHFNAVATEITSLDGPSAFGDYDNDDDLDVVHTGRNFFSNYSAAILERNNSYQMNTDPAAPAGLSSTPGGNGAALKWQSSQDNETSAAGLNYNLRIGTTPGGSEVSSPMAGNNGYRRIVAVGNARQDTTHNLANLLPGTYYWSVQALDNAFAGSAFAAEQSFFIRSNVRILSRRKLRKQLPPQILVRDTLRVSFLQPLEENQFVLSNVIVTIDTLLHANANDIEISLIHQNVTDTLIFDLQTNGANFIGTVLNDSAVMSIHHGSPPFTGEFRPVQPLSQFHGLDPEGDWYLRIFNRSTNTAGRLDAWSLELTFEIPTGISDNEIENIPGKYSLNQNYPNPFNPTTTIEFTLPNAGFVTLKIYNILGEKVTTLVSEKLAAGKYNYDWDASGLASGVYLYRLEAGAFNQTRKLILLK